MPFRSSCYKRKHSPFNIRRTLKEYAAVISFAVLLPDFFFTLLTFAPEFLIIIFCLLTFRRSWPALLLKRLFLFS